MGIADDREGRDIEELVDQCVSFIKIHNRKIAFVHQSARDYLAGGNEQSFLIHEPFGHAEIALNCLSYLSERLEINIARLPRPDSTIPVSVKEQQPILANIDYATTFWVDHLSAAKESTVIKSALSKQGDVLRFLSTKLLEWLECFILLGRLSYAIEKLRTMKDAADVSIADPLLVSLADFPHLGYTVSLGHCARRHTVSIATLPDVDEMAITDL